MLRSNFRSPIGGMFAGHILLLDPEPDYDLLRHVVDQLRELLGDSHPDVEALALALPEPRPSGTAYVFHTPPMLRRSWALVIAATARQPELIPPESLSAAIALRTWADEPWLLFTRLNTERASDMKPLTPTAEEDEETREAEDLLRAHLKRSSRGVPATPFAMDIALDTAGAPPAAPAPPAQASFPAPTSVAADEDTVQRLVRATGLPRTSVESMLARLGGQSR
jgi:hypothetical protein